MARDEAVGHGRSSDALPTRRSLRALESRTAATVKTPETAPRTTPVLASVPPVRRGPGRLLRTAISSVAVAAIAGLVAVSALPAYSVDPTADSQAAIEAAARVQALGNQKLTVAPTALQEQVIRDSFSAPTQQQLDEAAAQARALAAAAAEQAAREAEAARSAQSTQAAQPASGTSGASTSVTPRQEGDDYPWRDQLTDDQGGGLSPLRYYYRECVDFVAWRLNRDQGSTSAPFKWTWATLTPGGGSAYAWPGQWASHGWKTSSAPVPGAVAWFTGNHVAYVQSVNADGTVSLEEYNWGNDHAYHRRTIPASDVALFLYPPS
ncbi:MULTISPECIES: CHAP domain-containing protein [unclassified Rathayibacter]|uniref:CHAP domain-containing protein n=1 Tax=unclassified Rathayibacter TaxID=2609250 RepID=UPI00188BA228|nr:MULTISPECIES: CHAP domain-containing protein [unclassified Rathayibacter]MBF4462733.1 CHAP domain-containing protein [Rathayibacter sp. VKM Ac-2879]MBF4504147.1 CHAP domain-containing protein [Rathayibacter sp. VKM Ac-2878]